MCTWKETAWWQSWKRHMERRRVVKSVTAEWFFFFQKNELLFSENYLSGLCNCIFGISGNEMPGWWKVGGFPREAVMRNCKNAEGIWSTTLWKLGWDRLKGTIKDLLFAPTTVLLLLWIPLKFKWGVALAGFHGMCQFPLVDHSTGADTLPWSLVRRAYLFKWNLHSLVGGSGRGKGRGTLFWVKVTSSAGFPNFRGFSSFLGYLVYLTSGPAIMWYKVKPGNQNGNPKGRHKQPW